jgi:hypothetical protein
MSNKDDVLLLLAGIETGELIVKGYTSEWMKRPKNARKMTIIIEDTRVI